MGADGGQLRSVREVRLEAEAQKAACNGLKDYWPERSAHIRLNKPQCIALALCALGFIALGILAGPNAGSWFRPLGWTLFAVSICLRLGSAAALLAGKAGGNPYRWRGEIPVYTVLCPLYREQGELPRLIKSLESLDYPPDRLDVKLLLEADDDATIQVARAHMKPWIELVVLAPCLPRTKPKALNAGLSRARGRFLTVYDAEDRPHPGQLRAALAAFAGAGSALGCVQAPLLIDNGARSWLSSQFAAEYAIQFLGLNSLLVWLKAPLPLGGTSNHFRTEALRASGGWDSCNVTEDADIGFRLARDGWEMACIDPPTWEEAPIRLGSWLNQRSRWIKGHLQTWFVLMRDPTLLWRELGWRNFFAVQALLGVGICAVFAHGPLLLVLLSCVIYRQAVHPIDGALLLSGVAASWLAAVAAAARLRSWRMVVTALTMPLYWSLLSVAALLAVRDFIVRPHHWSKTEHGCRHTP